MTTKTKSPIYGILAPLGDRVEVCYGGFWRGLNHGGIAAPFGLDFTDPAGWYRFRVNDRVGSEFQISAFDGPGFEALREWVRSHGLPAPAAEPTPAPETGKPDTVTETIRFVEDAMRKGEAVVLIGIPGLDEAETEALGQAVQTLAREILAAKSLTPAQRAAVQFSQILERLSREGRL